MEFVLEFCLGAFGAGADRFGVVAVEGARGFGVVSLSFPLVSGAESYIGERERGREVE